MTKIQSNFFRWQPNSRHDSELLSFRVSPTTASSSQFQPTVNFYSPPLALSIPPAQPPATQLVKCLATGCKSARIRKGCTYQRCKHHCKEQGGCLSHGNTQLDLTPPSSIADPTLWNAIPLAETLGQPPVTPLVIATQAPHRAEPIHASHILPVFTERWATEHSLREEQRKQDAEKLANLQKTKHTVFVYAWIQVRFSNAHIILGCHS